LKEAAFLKTLYPYFLLQATTLAAMAEPQTPHETSVPSQKRPLEEPSSPSGPNDGPDAKRPALDKVIRDESAAEIEVTEAPNIEDATNEEETKDKEPVAEASTDNAEPSAVADATDKQGDTVVPDAPVSANGTAATNQILETKPKQSTSTTEDNRASSHPQQHDTRDETGWLHVRAIISSAEAATVIGKGGENVSQIRRMAGAKCTVSEYSRGAVERILTVSGLVDAVAKVCQMKRTLLAYKFTNFSKAFGLIIRTLNQEPLDQPSTPQSKTYPLRLLIPHILIGSIIGKQGVRIREIQEASGARLNASESCLPLSTERSLVVLGVADAVHIATYYVGSTLVEQLTERFGGPAASAYAVRHGGPQGVVPGGMQVVPYVPQHAGGQMGHPDQYRGRQGQQPGRTPAPQYAMPYQQGQPPMQHPQGQMGYSAGSPRTPYVGAGPQQPQQQYGHAGPAQPGPAAAQQPMQGGAAFPGQPITQQIFIPNDMVGAIIGKGGAKINEIRQLSGSVIKINEPQDNNNERLVTITGTQECNQMALYMLYSRLGESSKNSNAAMPR
jgi:heterogeneous nuclear rnp K-like protein 2